MGQSNVRVLKKLLVVAACMFGFGYAMVPFYYKICEVTGINAGDEQALDGIGLNINTRAPAGISGESVAEK